MKGFAQDNVLASPETLRGAPGLLLGRRSLAALAAARRRGRRARGSFPTPQQRQHTTKTKKHSKTSATRRPSTRAPLAPTPSRACRTFARRCSRA